MKGYGLPRAGKRHGGKGPYQRVRRIASGRCEIPHSRGMHTLIQSRDMARVEGVYEKG